MKRYISLLLCAILALSLFACGNNDGGSSEQETSETTAQTNDSILASPTEARDTEMLKNYIRGFNIDPTVEEKLVYNDNNMSVTVKSLEYETTGPKLVLSVSNDMDNDIIVQSSHAVINGKMINPKMQERIPSGKAMDTEMSFLFFDLAVSGINELKTIDFLLEVSDNTYNNAFKTDLISVSTSAPQDDDPDVKKESDGPVVYDSNGIKIVIEDLNSDHTYDEASDLTDKLVVSIYNDTDSNISVLAKDLEINGWEFIPVMNCLVFPHKQATYYDTIFVKDLNEHGITSIDSIKVSFTVKNMDTGERFDTDPVSFKLSDNTIERPATPDQPVPQK